jgi:Ca2+-binding RTX toxin-like protein
MTPLGPATDVAGEGSSDFDLAVAGDGSFVVARVTGNPFDVVERHVEVVRYSASGEQVGQVMRLADGPASPSDVAVAMDADGDAVVTWANDGIYVARISRAGVATAPVNVAPGVDPAVSMDDGGGYFLAWTAVNTLANDVELRVRAFDKDGNARAAAFTALEVGLPSASIGDIDIDVRSDGSGAVVVAAETFESSLDNVAFARVGVAALVEAGAIHAAALNEADPAVAVNADGSFEIGYTTYEKVGGSGGDPVGLSIVVQRFDSGGDTVGNAIALWLASDDADVPKDPLHTPAGVVSLDMAPSGGFIASWARTINTGVGSEFSPTFVQRFDALGVADSDGPLPLVSNSGVNRIGFDGNGQAVVTYLPAQDLAPLRFMRVAVGQDYAFIERDDFLHIVGTGVDDVISITLSGTDYIVSRGGHELRFAWSSVHVLLIDGLDGNDSITNDTELIATLRGGDGADTVFGGSGTDRIHGGPGNDSLWGSGGADRLYGEDGVDSMYGNGGNDRLEGGAQGDHMRGNGGRDMMVGNGGHDRMYGGASADRMYGQAGNDQLFGEGGNDRLYGDDDPGFVDSLYGGAGDDVFITVDGVIDHVFGDGGDDSANADADDVLVSIAKTAG